jgi:predicted nuclease of predicted toxin-antitoxin system
MRFLFDQSADFRLIPYLVKLDHDVSAVSREHPGGLPDEEVLAIASNEGRILITADLDFGDLVFKDGLKHAGILLMRLPGVPLRTKEARLAYVLSQFAADLDQFLVVTEHNVRVRRIPPP